jgi:hypothetical protein
VIVTHVEPGARPREDGAADERVLVLEAALDTVALPDARLGLAQPLEEARTQLTRAANAVPCEERLVRGGMRVAGRSGHVVEDGAHGGERAAEDARREAGCLLCDLL